MRAAPLCILSMTMPLLLIPAIVAADVKVEKKPPVVEYKTFDPANKPADLPPMKEGELAVTTSEFEYAATLSFTQLKRDIPGGKCRMTYHVERVKVPIGLRIVVWLPNNVTPKLKAHEEGHRRISEAYYKDAEKAAKTAAGKMDSRRYEGEGEGDGCIKAADAALNAASQKSSDEYLQLTSKAAQRAHEIYDEITAHGSKPEVDELAAVPKAIAQQQAEARQAGKPSTKAATKPAAKPATPAPGGRPAK